MREKDLSLQEQMIKFSIFLQENEKKKKKFDEKIKQEKEVTDTPVTHTSSVGNRAQGL